MMERTISGHMAITSLLRKAYNRRDYVPGRPVWLETRRAYLPIFLRLAVLLDNTEQLKARNTWSYNYRKARMASGVSDHAGYAIDCWSDGIGTHTWPSKMPKATAERISAILDNFRTKDGRYVFGWGICADSPGVTYKGPTYSKHVSNDPMHFFIAPGISVTDALRVRRAMKIRADGTIGK